MSDENTWDDENVRGAQLYQQGRYAEAEQAFRAALEAAEQLGPNDTRVAVVLNNLASLCHNQRKIEEAQTLYERALAIRRQALGESHPMVAQSLNNLSSLYRELGRHSEAEQFSRQAVSIAEGVFGPDHYRITNCLNNLAAVYMVQARYGEAEQIFQRTLTIRRRFFGDKDPTVATTLSGLAELAQAQAQYTEAESFFRRALIIREEQLGMEHPGVATLLEKFAGLLRQTAREEEAAGMETRARSIRAKQRTQIVVGHSMLCPCGSSTNKKKPFLLKPVIALRTTGENLVQRVWRHAHRFDHFRCVGKAVEMWIVGCPQNVICSQVIGKQWERPFHRFKRNKTLSTEDVTWSCREPGIIHADVVEMTVHTVEPTGHPTTAGFQKCNTKTWKAITHPTHDKARCCRHHLKRVGDDVSHRTASGKTIHC